MFRRPRARRVQLEATALGAPAARPATENTAGTEAPALELLDVSVRFTAPSGVFTAVEGVSLSARAGEFVAIVGPTGSGKSTLLNVAAGLSAPSAGGARVFGAPLPGLNRHAGYLFQSDALMPWKTALDNVAIGVEVRGIARKAAREQARAWLAKVALGRFAQSYPHQLSGGMRKRCALAQVLIRTRRSCSWTSPSRPSTSRPGTSWKTCS